MPRKEVDDEVFPVAEGMLDTIVCDLCGQRMVRTGGCYFCNNCGQKKCNTDIT